MVYFLTNKAVLQNSPVLQWDCANEYMHLFGMNPDSGKNYRDVQARFIRVAYMNILVEYLDPEGKFVDSWKCPLVQKARIAADTDGEGNWKATESLAKMLDTDQAVGLRPESSRSCWPTLCRSRSRSSMRLGRNTALWIS